MSLTVCLSVCLCLCHSVCHSVCLSVCMYVFLSVSVSQSLCLCLWQENTAASMSGPLTEGTTAQLTSSAEAVDAWDSEQTFAKQLIDPWEAADHIESQPPCSPPPKKPQNDNYFELQSMSFEDETIAQTPRQTRSKTKQTRVTDSFFRVDTNLSEKRAGRAKNGLHDS